jgi:hypothetical protein
VSDRTASRRLRRRSGPRAIVLAAMCLLAAAPLLGHESRPGYLELRALAPERYALLWKQPARGDLVLDLEPVLPASCRRIGGESLERMAGALLERAAVECPDGLAGRALAISGLEATLTDVVVRIEYLDGRVETALLRPAEPSYRVHGVPNAAARAAGYLRLGVLHIAFGPDHLLFVLGLLLIARSPRGLVLTVTCFTVAHSLTLGAATFGWASAPSAPLEAAIALSILFLGPEIVRAARGESSFTLRHPWIASFAFGLLHGFGFAGGLEAMGLPRAEIPVALLLFNSGVELGQLAFVASMLAGTRLLRRARARWPSWIALVPAYVVGTAGAFWTLQRVASLLIGGG